MNPLNYASLEASKRLVDNGIVLETERYWLKENSGWRLWLHSEGLQDHYLKYGDLCVPAPSMAEVWKELPLGTRAYRGEVFTEAYLKTYKHDVIISENPADALIDLLILFTDNERKKRRTL